MVVGSVGKLGLPSSGGVSSSAALTGAFSMGLATLLGMFGGQRPAVADTAGAETAAVESAASRSLSLNRLAQVDYGEYFLGKVYGRGH